MQSGGWGIAEKEERRHGKQQNQTTSSEDGQGRREENMHGLKWVEESFWCLVDGKDMLPCWRGSSQSHQEPPTYSTWKAKYQLCVMPTWHVHSLMPSPPKWPSSTQTRFYTIAMGFCRINPRFPPIYCKCIYLYLSSILIQNCLNVFYL